MKIKEGVSLKKLQPQMTPVMIIADCEYRNYGSEAVITSGDDSHDGKNSLHNDGLALDFRIKNLHTYEAAVEVKRAIKNALGAQYDVVLEKDHIHVEFDPKV